MKKAQLIPYVIDSEQRCIVSIVILPCSNSDYGKYHIFVGWEYENAVKNGYVKFYMSRKPVEIVTQEEIIEVCDYGYKMVKEQILEIFPKILIDNILNSN